MGMIEEIKDRLDSACAGVAYLDCEGMPLESGDGPDAEGDMRWMMDRIEELEAGGEPCAEFAAIKAERDALLKVREALSNLTGNVELYINHYLGGDQNKELSDEVQEFLGPWVVEANKALKGDA